MTVLTTPLSARVTAPPQLPVPEHADVALWRPATAADTDAIWQLEIAIGRVDHPNYVRERDDVSEAFTFSFINVDTDTLVGFDADERAPQNVSLYERFDLACARNFLSLDRMPAEPVREFVLAAQLAASRAAGHERATLDVDSASPAGALDLYTGMGFFITNRELAYVLEF